MAPTEQHGFFLESSGGKFAVKTKSVPAPGPGDVLVKVEAAALNPVDWKIQAYKLDFLAFPAVLGTDAAGTVEDVGEGVTSLKKGDKMFVLFSSSLPPSRC